MRLGKKTQKTSMKSENLFKSKKMVGSDFFIPGARLAFTKLRQTVMIRSLFLAYYIYGMICSLYQLFVRCILSCVVVFVVIISRQKTIYFSYFVPRFLFSLSTFIDFI